MSFWFATKINFQNLRVIRTLHGKEFIKCFLLRRIIALLIDGYRPKVIRSDNINFGIQDVCNLMRNNIWNALVIDFETALFPQ